MLLERADLGRPAGRPNTAKAIEEWGGSWCIVVVYQPEVAAALRFRPTGGGFIQTGLIRSYADTRTRPACKMCNRMVRCRSGITSIQRLDCHTSMNTTSRSVKLKRSSLALFKIIQEYVGVMILGLRSVRLWKDGI